MAGRGARAPAFQKGLQAEHCVGTEQENMGLVALLPFGTQMDSSTQGYARTRTHTKSYFTNAHLCKVIHRGGGCVPIFSDEFIFNRCSEPGHRL